MFERIRSKFREIADIKNGKDITRGYVDSLQYLNPQDKIFELAGFDYEVYRKILSDDQVFTAFQQRRLAVLSKPWKIKPANDSAEAKKVADFVQKTLDSIEFNQVLDKMLYGRFYGYAVAEIVWEKTPIGIGIKNIFVRRCERFVFDVDKQLKLRTTADYNGAVVPNKKFWHYSTGADNSDEPYGLGLAHYLYWIEAFKRGGVKFWMTFLEKFGSPTAVGTYHSRATNSEKTKFLNALHGLKNSSALIKPEGMEMELIEAKRSGRGGGYEMFYDRMNKAISKVVLGQTMTTEDGSSKSQAGVHLEVREDLIIADAKLIASSFNTTVLKWLVDYNFNVDEYPSFEFKLTDDDDLDKKATRDKTLSEASGMNLDKQYVEDTYGVKLAQKITDTAEFASASTEVDKLQTNLEQQLDAADTKTINTIKNIVDTADDLEDLRDKLITAFTDIDDSEFTKLMAQALEVAALAGRSDVIDEVL